MRYTVIVEVEDGTYISQVIAANEVAAALAWCEKFPTETIKGLKQKKLVASVREVLKEFDLAALDGLEGVWCLSPWYGKKSALINIVRNG